MVARPQLYWASINSDLAFMHLHLPAGLFSTIDYTKCMVDPPMAHNISRNQRAHEATLPVLLRHLSQILSLSHLLSWLSDVSLWLSANANLIFD